MTTPQQEVPETDMFIEGKELSDRIGDLIHEYEQRTGHMVSEMEMVRGVSESMDRHPPLKELNLTIRL